MKNILALSALIALASPALAQDAAPAADPAAPAPVAAPAPAPDAPDPVGGYQPDHPALSGTPAPGQQVIFQAAPPPDVAYPAPAPLPSYPICKKGQFDNCRQRGG